MVQRGHNFAIVDEVDSILVDEARTPLIISGPLDDRSDLYNTIDAFIPLLSAEDYEIDEKQRSANFSEVGTEKLEGLLKQAGLLKGSALYDIENVAIVHHINNALKAHKLFQRDKDYVVRNGEIVIIDEFTGRMHAGPPLLRGPCTRRSRPRKRCRSSQKTRRWRTITFQNYFRMYGKLAGMTGTARDGSGRIRQHLRPRCHRSADQPADPAHRRRRRGLPDLRGEVQGDHRRDRRRHRSAASRCSSARPPSRNPNFWLS